jgi:hypothetical protein
MPSSTASLFLSAALACRAVWHFLNLKRFEETERLIILYVLLAEPKTQKGIMACFECTVIFKRLSKAKVERHVYQIHLRQRILLPLGFKVLTDRPRESPPPPVALQSLKDLGRLTYRRFLELSRHMVGLLGRVIRPSQGLYLHSTTQHRKTRTNIHGLSGIRTHDPSKQPAKTHASDRTATVTGSREIRMWKFKLGWMAKDMVHLRGLIRRHSSFARFNKAPFSICEV